MNSRMPIPEFIVNKPYLMKGLDLFLDAFFALHSDRALGPSGEGQIPWSSIRQYAEEYGITGSQRELLFYHVRSLDNAYAKFRAKKVEDETPPISDDI